MVIFRENCLCIQVSTISESSYKSITRIQIIASCDNMQNTQKKIICINFCMVELTHNLKQEVHDGPESLTWVSFPTKWILPSLLLLFQLMTPKWGQFWAQGYHMNRIDIGPNIIVQGQMIKGLLLLVSEKNNFKVFLLCSYVSNLWPPGQGQFWPQAHHMNNFGRGPLGDATYEISKLCTF